MQPQLNLPQLLELVAKSYHYEDFRKLLEAFIVDIADARTDLGEGDTIQSRRGLAMYLQKQLDALRRHKDNTNVQRTKSFDDV